MTEEKQLPPSWMLVPLKELAKRITKGSTPTSYGYQFQDSGIRFVKIENVRNGEIDKRSIRQFISEEAHLSQSRSILEAGDILYSIAGTIGTTCLVKIEDLPANTNQALAIVRGTQDKVEAQYLRYFLQSNLASRQVEFVARGGGMNNISLQDVGEIEIPLAPLNEQRRIVEKLDELMGRLATAREKLERVPRLLAHFRRAVLSAACSGALTRDWREENGGTESAKIIVDAIEMRRMSAAITPAQRQRISRIYATTEEETSELPETWQFIALSKLADSFDYGTSAKSSKEGTIPVLRMGNIQNGKLDWNDLVFTSDEDEIQKYSLEPMTVLFNRTNSPELVGKTALYRGERPAIFAGYLIRTNVEPELNAEYLNICLNTPRAKEYCLQVKTDGVSQSNINAQKLGNFEIPFCRLDEQIEIVRRVNELLSLADLLEARYTKAKTFFDRLPTAILTKAFRGELVPQDPDDESVEQLLERLRAGQSDAPKKGRKRVAGGEVAKKGRKAVASAGLTLF